MCANVCNTDGETCVSIYIVHDNYILYNNEQTYILTTSLNFNDKKCEKNKKKRSSVIGEQLRPRVHFVLY